MDENASGLALHLDDDLGESSLTDLLELGQHTGAEHDLFIELYVGKNWENDSMKFETLVVVD